jgi:hypothetical protein
MNQELYNDIDYGQEIQPEQYEPAYVMSIVDHPEATLTITPLPGKRITWRYYDRIVPGESTVHFEEYWTE